MKSKTIAVIIVAIFTLGIAATAQVAKTNARAKTKAEARTHTGERGGAIARQLGLTTEQKQKIGEIVKGYYAEIKPILQSSATLEEKKAQIEPIKARTADAIMAELTPDQQAKAKDSGVIDRILSPTKHRAGAMMYALNHLGLSDQQKAQIKDIFQASREKAKAIKEDTSLTQEQKKTQFMDLRKATREQIMGVLTPEQQQKLQEMCKQKRGQGDGQTQGKAKTGRWAGQKTQAK